MKLIIAICLSTLTSCGTFASVSNDSDNSEKSLIYSGVREDIRILRVIHDPKHSLTKNDPIGDVTKYAISMPFFLVDGILSTAVDTLILPYTITREYFKTEPENPADTAR